MYVVIYITEQMCANSSMFIGGHMKGVDWVHMNLLRKERINFNRNDAVLYCMQNQVQPSGMGE